VPFILYSLSEDFAAATVAASGAGNPDEADRYFKLSQTAYYTFAGTVVVTASMMINTVYHLVEYIIASQFNR
jgi:hypothetical protein